MLLRVAKGVGKDSNFVAREIPTQSESLFQDWLGFETVWVRVYMVIEYCSRVVDSNACRLFCGYIESPATR